VRSDRRLRWLNDIVRESDELSGFIAGMTIAKFQENRIVTKAVIKTIENISEAVGRLLNDERSHGVDVPLAQLYPNIPWKSVKGMGDVIRHEYDRLDYNLIWTTAIESVPRLRTVVLSEMERLRKIVPDEPPRGTTPSP